MLHGMVWIASLPKPVFAVDVLWQIWEYSRMQIGIESQGVRQWAVRALLLASLGAVFLVFQPSAHAETGLSYAVEIEGADDGNLRSLLRQSSQLVALRENPPATVTGIRRRAQQDLDRLAAVLRSEGYYAGGVTYEVDSERSPVVVRLAVLPGERFRLRSFNITYSDQVGEGLPVTIGDLPDARGQPATGRFVLALQAQVIDHLHDNGFPFAEVRDRTAQAQMADARLDVSLVIDPGPRATFGQVDLVNPTRTDDEYVMERVSWTAGDSFSRQALRDVHAGLEETGLFSRVSVEPSSAPNGDGALDVRVELTERKPRTVGVGLRYGTSEGAGARVYWEHRNLWGRAQRLRLEAEVSEIRQIASAELRQPDFMRVDQDLLTTLSLFNVVAESYDETGVSASVGLSRRLARHLMGQAGVEARVSVVDDGDGRRDTRLLRFPAGLSYDSSNNVLDPSAGLRASLSVVPTVGESETDLLYVTTEMHAATYYALDEENHVVVALRARLGSIAGEGNFDLPASERFYSGGGGSVRGIGYQLAGPIDADRDPIGGRSVVELGAELRIRVTDKIGIVPFVEGGSVFTSDVPDFSEDLRWGAGVGLRYYTAFGPIRLDIAMPLNRRDDIDDVVQVYISLGQAF